MSSSELREIVNALGPTDKLIWDIALYAIFLFNILILLLLPDGASLHTAMCIGVLMCAVIDKTYAFGYFFDSTRYTPQTCHAKIFIGTYLIRAAMFILPAIIAGSTQSGKVRGVAILTAVGGAAYTLARWYLDQREVENPEITCMVYGQIAQSALLVLPLAALTLRRRLGLRGIDRDVPLTVTWEPGAHQVEI